jgi:hypothetical protein
MDIFLYIAGAVMCFLLAQVILLKLRLRAQEREFTEFRRSVVMVPIPAKKKQSPWIPVFAISTLLLALAVLLMALR